MTYNTGYAEEKGNCLKTTADILFDYLRNVIYDPSKAVLNTDQLPEEFRDLGKGLIYFSDPFLKLSDIKDGKNISGKGLRELFSNILSEEYVILIDDFVKSAINEKTLLKIEKDIDIGVNGTMRHYEIQAAPMFNKDNGYEGIIVLFHDMTDIINANREAEQALKIAEQSSRAKSEFLARMSHEMRTPINVIMGMAAIYKITGDSKRRDYCVDKISEASGNLLGSINDILDMSNMETNKFQLTRNAFNLKNLLNRVTGTALFKADERMQKFSVSIASDMPERIISDEKRLGQILENLLSNAVKFTPEKGEIYFTAEKTRDGDHSCIIKFTVKDNGIGISEEQQRHMFIPFEQIEGGFSRKFGGLGLGLSISKHIIDMMGGNIRVESEQGKGTAFIFEIPAEKAGEAALKEKDKNIPAFP